MRNLINLVEAVQRGCPLATHDIDENLKNRQTAIDEYHYGPANPDRAEDYWTKSARGFKVSVATARTMQCGNCAAFDVSDSMRECIAAGIRGDATGVDAKRCGSRVCPTMFGMMAGRAGDIASGGKDGIKEEESSEGDLFRRVRGQGC